MSSLKYVLCVGDCIRLKCFIFNNGRRLRKKIEELQSLDSRVKLEIVVFDNGITNSILSNLFTEYI
jgi:hypothetical protein